MKPKQKLLFLSWRDIHNPKAGGAEIFTHEMLKRLVAARHEVDHFGCDFPNAKPEEVIDGVRYLRQGGHFSVIRKAYQWYQKHKKEYDYVIDQCNTHQFFSPLWVQKSKRIFFIHQLTREIWFYHTRFPFNYIGNWAESIALRMHRNDKVMTVSNSTKEDLLSLGFKTNKITVLPEGLDFLPWKKQQLLEKEKNFTLLYLGRFAKYKGIEDTIKAFKIIQKQNPKAKLWLVGKVSETYRKKLESLLPLKQRKTLTFWGFVSEEKKFELMSSAHAIVVPSIREGWGLIVTEANAVGTTAVVYDSPGLRDSVQHNQTGLVCQQNTPENLAFTLQTLQHNPQLRKKLTHNAHTWSFDFHWDNTGRAANQFFQKLAIN